MLQDREQQRYIADDVSSVFQGSFFVDFSLKLADEDTVDGIRKTLREGINWLSSTNPGLKPLVCEIDISPDVIPIVIWKTPEQLDLPTGSALERWFARAVANGGEFERLEGHARWGLLLPHSIGANWGRFTGFFIHGIEPDGDQRTLLIAFARLTASALRRVEKISTQQAATRRQKEIQNETLAWMENGADVLWDATPDGLIHCRRVLNHRTDISKNIDRRNLRQFVIGAENKNLYELLKNGLPVRHQPVHYLDSSIELTTAANQLIVSVTPQFSGAEKLLSFVGTFTSVPRMGLIPANDLAGTSAITLRVKRDREERHRIDNDNMLEGLRLLVDNRSPRENLNRLIQLICGNLDGRNPILVESGFDGHPRLILPERKRLNYAAGAVLDILATSLAQGRLAFFDEGTKEHERIHDAFALEGRRIAVFSLPLRGQISYLICTTDKTEKMSSADIAFVERFAFILRQALILRAEQSQLAQTAKMAALGQMSASIAHELKQPLNTISLATQNLESLLMMPNMDPAAVEAKLARVMSQVERASNIIDRMRRFGRKSLEESSTFIVRDVIEGVLLIMSHVLDHQNIEVELDLMPGLMISGDELQFEQVLMNVIQNSVDAIAGIGAPSGPSADKHAPARAGKIRFRSFVSEDNPNINIIRVEDNGPGFSAAANERAAEAFFTTKPAEHGTGLGLAICEAIIRECGGRFTYGNYEDGGYVSFAMPVTK